jgi:hypothetical protein
MLDEWEIRNPQMYPYLFLRPGILLNAEISDAALGSSLSTISLIT